MDDSPIPLIVRRRSTLDLGTRFDGNAVLKLQPPFAFPYTP
uniref:Uncharacterized protein n=1 Tax=Anguilla anguilla TaxID=7936 RepID=A0A0E9V7F0_ANGAN